MSRKWGCLTNLPKGGQVNTGNLWLVWVHILLWGLLQIRPIIYGRRLKKSILTWIIIFIFMPWLKPFQWGLFFLWICSWIDCSVCWIWLHHMCHHWFVLCANYKYTWLSQLVVNEVVHLSVGKCSQSLSHKIVPTIFLKSIKREYRHWPTHYSFSIIVRNTRRSKVDQPSLKEHVCPLALKPFNYAHPTD